MLCYVTALQISFTEMYSIIVSILLLIFRHLKIELNKHLGPKGILIPYTRNFSRYVNFTDFVVSRAAVKIYSVKILPSCVI